LQRGAACLNPAPPGGNAADSVVSRVTRVHSSATKPNSRQRKAIRCEGTDRIDERSHTFGLIHAMHGPVKECSLAVLRTNRPIRQLTVLAIIICLVLQSISVTLDSLEVVHSAKSTHLEKISPALEENFDAGLFFEWPLETVFFLTIFLCYNKRKCA
jgi:hypothetical protein